MPQSAPFSFQSFDAPHASAGNAPEKSATTFTQADLDAAFAAGRIEGVETGRKTALDSLSAAETKALEKIAAAFEAERITLRDGLTDTAVDLRKTASAVVSHICASFAQARELEIATHLIERLVAISDERAPVSIGVSASSSKDLCTKLEALLTTRKLDDFIVVEMDKALRPGDVRLSWRGGAVQQTHKEIRAVIDAAFAETFSDKEAKK